MTCLEILHISFVNDTIAQTIAILQKVERVFHFSFKLICRIFFMPNEVERKQVNKSKIIPIPY